MSEVEIKARIGRDDIALVELAGGGLQVHRKARSLAVSDGFAAKM
jgi:hypothetical protein